MQNQALQLPLFDAEDEQSDQRSQGFSVRKSDRAKRLSIKVFPRGRVEVVVPRRTSAKSVQAFVDENKTWIERARQSFSEQYEPEPFALPKVIRLPAIDRELAVRYQPKKGAGRVHYRDVDGILTLTGMISDEKRCVAALKRWLSSTARKAFEPRLKSLSVLTESPFSKIQIRMQRTCWGSRSSSGTISLNLCLLFLDPGLLRYLMIHELCHGQHMNHSKRFWRLVARYEPDYRNLDRCLGESWREVPVWLGVY